MHVFRLGLGLLAGGIFVGAGCAGESRSRDADAAGGTTGGAGGTAARGGAAGRPPSCAADYPCFGPSATCVDTRRIQKLMTVGCEVFCGDIPCSGGMCVPDGEPEACPEGTRCRSHGRQQASCDPFDPNSGVAGAGDPPGASGEAGMSAAAGASGEGGASR